MLEITLLETGISILEKLAGLLKLSHASKQEQYDNLAKPIFEDMKSIHKNYLHMFIKAKRALETTQDIKRVSDSHNCEVIERKIEGGSVASNFIEKMGSGIR